MGTQGPVSINTKSPVVDWSNVPADVLGLITSKITWIEDHLTLAAVCTWWRSAATQSKSHLVDHNTWLLSASHNPNTAERVAYSFTGRKQFQIPLPEITGRNVHGSPFGWLVTSHVDTPKINLFNPVSRATIPLPDPTHDVTKALLTANPCDPNCLAVIMINDSHAKLSFAKPGLDSAWSEIDTSKLALLSDKNSSLIDLVHVNRMLYVLGTHGWLLVFDLSAAAPHVPLASLEPPQPMRSHIPPRLYLRQVCHLVELGREVCMVVSYGDYCSIEIYKMDDKEWARVDSLGNSCLLLDNT